MTDENRRKKPEWWDDPEGDSQASSGWLAIFSFLKPHLFADRDISQEQEEQSIESHPILVKWSARLKREPKNDALRIAMEEYIKDKHLKKSDWM